MLVLSGAGFSMGVFVHVSVCVCESVSSRSHTECPAAHWYGPTYLGMYDQRRAMRTPSLSPSPVHNIIIDDHGGSRCAMLCDVSRVSVFESNINQNDVVCVCIVYDNMSLRWIETAEIIDNVISGQTSACITVYWWLCILLNGKTSEILNYKSMKSMILRRALLLNKSFWKYFCISIWYFLFLLFEMYKK